MPTARLLVHIADPFDIPRGLPHRVIFVNVGPFGERGAAHRRVGIIGRFMQRNYAAVSYAILNVSEPDLAKQTLHELQDNANRVVAVSAGLRQPVVIGNDNGGDDYEGFMPISGADLIVNLYKEKKPSPYTALITGWKPRKPPELPPGVACVVLNRAKKRPFRAFLKRSVAQILSTPAAGP